MITSENLASVSYLLFKPDLLNPLEDDLKIIFNKPEFQYVKEVTPNITMLNNEIIIIEWCLVVLIDEDLPNGKINLPHFGEYKITIETKDTLSVNWNIMWKDLFRITGNEITYYGLN
jgi:hypothetical protein